MKEQPTRNKVNTKQPTRRPPTSRQPSRKPSASQQLSRDELRRERAQKAKKRRRRNQIIGSCIGIVLLIGICVALSLTVLFHIESVEVLGDEAYSSEQIIESSDIHTGDNMFLMNKKQAKINIETALPYVEDASIKRSITGKITIMITAATPRLALDNGESFTLISGKGKVLEDNLVSVNEDIIILTVPEVQSAVPGKMLAFEDSTVIETITSILNAMDINALTGISAMDITDTSNVYLKFKDRISIALGDVSTIAEKMNFVKATLDKVDTDTPDFEGSIDFTIEKKAYLKPKEAAKPEVQAPESQTVAA